MSDISEVSTRAKAAFNEYASLNNRTLTDIENVISLACNDLEHLFVWKIEFESAPEVLIELCFQEQQQLCKISLDDVRAAPSDGMLSVTALTAYACSSNWKETCFNLGCLDRSDDVRKYWLESFNEFPKFEQVLINHEHKLMQKRQAYESFKAPQPAAYQYEVVIPVAVFTDNTVKGDKLPEEAVAYLFNMPLKLYQFVDDKLCDDVVKYTDNALHIVFDSEHQLGKDELQLMSLKLEGQLTDGWGESILNKRYLHKNNVYRVEFDTSGLQIRLRNPYNSDELNI